MGLFLKVQDKGEQNTEMNKGEFVNVVEIALVQNLTPGKNLKR